MKSFVAWAMLLAFVMGLGYANFGHLSKHCDENPWEETRQKPCKSEASQKEIRAVNWEEGNV